MTDELTKSLGLPRFSRLARESRAAGDTDVHVEKDDDPDAPPKPKWEGRHHVADLRQAHSFNSISERNDHAFVGPPDRIADAHDRLVRSLHDTHDYLGGSHTLVDGRSVAMSMWRKRGDPYARTMSVFHNGDDRGVAMSDGESTLHVADSDIPHMLMAPGTDVPHGSDGFMAIHGLINSRKRRSGE